jgi:glycosyltransferase involved in cell wall biosynthesis
MPISTNVLFTRKRRAIVSVINDLVSDARVMRTAGTLRELGFDVMLLGRRKPGSPPLPAWEFRASRFSMVFRSGPAFYIFFNLRLFFRLLFSRADLLYANDLDTLLPNYLVSRLRRIPLVYDSHELFCEVPELQVTPFKKRIWERLESWIVPRLSHCITVNGSIARIFGEKYKVPFSVVRNIGQPEAGATRTRAELGLPSSARLIILQGAGINVDRGAEELVEAMRNVNDAMLLIIGSGDVWNTLEKLASDPALREKVRLIHRLPRKELLAYTKLCDLGITIDKPTNLNYRYSLPNKVFDYIHCGVPVLASHLPEVETIVKGYGIGEFIESHDPAHIADRINTMLRGDLERYRTKCRAASQQLDWEHEKKNLINVVASAMGESPSSASS